MFFYRKIKRKESRNIGKAFVLKQKDMFRNIARCKTMTEAENLSLIFFSLKITHRLFSVPSTAVQGSDFQPVKTIAAGFSFFIRPNTQLKSV